MKRPLIDQVEFTVKAGNGGGGLVSFRREKYVAKGGPDGGDGGNGGSIYLIANPHMTTLLDYAGKTKFEANFGIGGHHRKQHGKDAEDLTLEVPVGTVVWQEQESEAGEMEWVKAADMDQPGMKALIAQGGAGGRGNDAFKSSINTTPEYAEPGQKGEEKYIRLELKLLADVGLVGLPNAGKSTLLSVLTAAKPEIANYPFTTITPNLGVMKVEDSAPSERNSVVIADIPGLIEDAHKGKGLGTDFLKHIERTKALVYVISPTEEDLEKMNNSQFSIFNLLWQQFETVRHEVLAYGHEVDEKPRLVAINKIDTVDSNQLTAVLRAFEAQGEQVICVSAATTQGIDDLKQKIASLLVD